MEDFRRLAQDRDLRSIVFWSVPLWGEVEKMLQEVLPSHLGPAVEPTTWALEPATERPMAWVFGCREAKRMPGTKPAMRMPSKRRPDQVVHLDRFWTCLIVYFYLFDVSICICESSV